MKNIPNTYKFCNNDINKFILLLRKGVYPHEYMDSWKDETTLTKWKSFLQQIISKRYYW